MLGSNYSVPKYIVKKKVITLSQKQFGKYFSIEIFPGSIGDNAGLLLRNFYSAKHGIISSSFL
jgi:hypothetical protein